MYQEKIISSIENEYFKKLLKIKNSKKYRKENLFFIEGYKNVKDSIKSKCQVVDIIISNEFKYKIEFPSAKILDKNLFSKLSDTINTQGIIALIQCIFNNNFTAKKSILLYKIRDPGNLGTILRTAVAASFEDVFLFNCVDVFNAKVIRSSMSAILKLNIKKIINDDIQNIIKNYYLIAFDIKGEDLYSIEKLNFEDKKYCLIFGNEANGIDEKIIKFSNKIVKIPMSNNIESLNVAVCAGIGMYYFNKIIKRV